MTHDTVTSRSYLSSYAALADPFSALVADLPPDAWSAPSPCAGWTAEDVLRHVVRTQQDFLDERGLARDLGQRGGSQASSGSPAADWQAQDEMLRAILGSQELAGREYEGHFGPTTVGDTLLRFYGFDLVIHRWDIARAAGREERFTTAELDLAEASIESFGPALYAEGICEGPLPVGPDADRQTRVLATLGRRG